MYETPTTWLSNCSDPNNPAHDNDYRCLAIFYGRTISGALSIGGCFLALVMIIIYKKYRQFTHRMIMYILVPSIILSSIFMYPYHRRNSDLYCEISGFFVNWCAFAQRLLIMCIVIHLLIFSIYERKPKHLELIFHVVVWSFSSFISLIPFYGHHYGYAGDWCWIKGETKKDNELRFACLYFWLLSFIVVEIVCFGLVIHTVRKQLKRGCSGMIAEKKKLYKKYIYPLLFYPLVNIVLAIPVTSNRVQNWVNPDNPVFGLYLCHSIIYPLWGFCNAMMYFMNKETIRQLHPCAIWERLTSWSRNTAYVELSSVPKRDVHVQQVDVSYATDALVTNPSALLSQDMNSSVNDME